MVGDCTISAKKIALAAGVDINLPVGAGCFLVEPCDDLCDDIAAKGFDGAGCVKMRAIAGLGDGQARPLGADTAYFEMGDHAPFEGA